MWSIASLWWYPLSIIAILLYSATPLLTVESPPQKHSKTWIHSLCYSFKAHLSFVTAHWHTLYSTFVPYTASLHFLFSFFFFFGGGGIYCWPVQANTLPLITKTYSETWKYFTLLLYLLTEGSYTCRYILHALVRNTETRTLLNFNLSVSASFQAFSCC